MAEAPTHYQQWSFAQRARWFHDLSPGIEDDGMSHLVPQQFQTPAASVLAHKGGTVEVDYVDFDPIDGDSFKQTSEKSLPRCLMERSIDQIDSQNSGSFLLLAGRQIAKVDVQKYVV